MLSVIACIVFTFSLGLLFRSLQGKKLKVFNIVFINYLVCSSIGLFKINYASLHQNHTVLYFAILIGLMFITGFTVFAKSVQSSGLGITTMVQKLSVFATVLAAFFLGETVLTIQIIGLALSALALFLIFKYPANSSSDKISTQLLLTSFLIASGIEILFLLCSKKDWDLQVRENLTPLVFLSSSIFGGLYLILNKTYKISKMEVFYGILLGIPNYFSIDFLNISLNQGIDGAVFFPLLNISVILLSGITGFFFFKEKYTSRQFLGYLLAIISILFISFWK
ncbi:MAG: hypothetical protein HOP11_15285 [Saprospiraceae bacterium]|nr:hypothetical protein [Saprospiraceae bacterium]